MNLDMEKMDLALFLKQILEGEVMGPTLDMARSSDMGDRQFDQFQKSLKGIVRKSLKNAVLALSQYSDFTVDTSVVQSVEKPK